MDYLLFAQGDGGAAISASWAALIGTVVNAGFAAVVGWYLLTRAIPKMQADFAQTLKDQRIDHMEDAKQRRIDSEKTLSLIISHYEADGKRRDDMLKVELAEVACEG